MSWSCAETPARTSTTKTTASASATACSVCLAISLTMPVGFSGSKPPVSTTMNSCAADAGVAVVAVARQAGEVGDDGVARLRQAVEQRRLADVGPADDGDDRLHAGGRLSATARQAGRKAKTPPRARDDDEHAADDDRRHRDRRCRRSARRSLRFALGAREPVQRCRRRRRTPPTGRAPPARRGRGTAAPRRSRRRRRSACARRSAGRTHRRRRRSSASPPIASVPPTVLVQATVPRSASTQPTAAWNERAQTRSPTRSAGPIRSASRSTSLAPRGEPIGTSQRTVDATGSMPAMRGPWPTTQGVLEGGDDAGLRERQRIAGPLQLPELGAVERRRRPAPRDRRRARRRGRRRPAAPSRRARRAACATSPGPLSSATSSPSRVTTAGDLAVAADAGRDLGADVGAPERLAALGLDRDARCRRSRRCVTAPAVDGDRRAGTATAPMLLVPDRPHGDRRGDRLERLRLRACRRRTASSRRASAPASEPQPATQPTRPRAARASSFRRLGAARRRRRRLHAEQR